MKIHITIEFEPEPVAGKRIKICDTEVTPEPKRAKIADVPPPPIPALAEPPKVERKGAGPQFDTGFLAIVRDIKEPFTRRALAVASGVEVGLVTLRINRMAKRGWLEQPAAGLWQKTKTFGVKE